MNPVTLLLQMLPLLVFIVADAVFNNVTTSIVLAVAFAVVQMAAFYRKTRKFDWFILLDVGLIAGLGVVSIVFENELFFKVKPAIVEGAAIIFFLVLIFSPDAFLGTYFGRMIQGIQFTTEVTAAMKNMLVWMCGIMVVHIAAVLYTARYSSRTLWAFVSGPGFYLFLIPVMGIMFVKGSVARRKQRAKRARSVLPGFPGDRDRGWSKNSTGES